MLVMAVHGTTQDMLRDIVDVHQLGGATIRND